MEILTSIVGVNFRPTEVKTIVRNLDIGDIVTLEPEPSNPHDSNAIRVLYEDDFIGYIPRSENLEVGEALATFESYEAVVVGFLSDIKPSIEITFGA